MGELGYGKTTTDKFVSGVGAGIPRYKYTMLSLCYPFIMFIL